MNNPYLLAFALNLAVFGAVWTYVQHRFRLPFGLYLVVAATCVPLPVQLAPGRFFFIGDVVGIALFTIYALRRSRARESNNFKSLVTGIYSIGLIAWPLISTFFAVKYLNENAQPGDVAFFVLRSVAQLGFFWWAVRTGGVVSSVKPLLSIPAAFWLSFAVLGIMQFGRVIDVDAFWYLNSDYISLLRNPASGFMGMDKPQLAQWSSYVTCIALWLIAADSGALGFAALTMPFLSALIVFAIGSRQGLLAMALAVVCTSLLIALKTMGRVRLIRLAVVLLAALVVWPIAWNWIDPRRRELMFLQFGRLENISSLDELALQRDPSALVLARYIAEHPQRLYLGSGVGTESLVDTNYAGIRTYAEGEYLRVLWSGGLISLGSYLALLAILLGQGVRGLRCKSHFQLGEGALLFSMTTVGVFFAFGQFHLFTTTYHNVPCKYLLILTAGLLGGAVTRSYADSNAARLARLAERSSHWRRPVPESIPWGSREAS